MQTRFLAVRGCVAASLLFSVVLSASAMPIPPAATTTNCVTSSCSLYMAATGNASANLSGADTFSYPADWVSTNFRFVEDAAFSTQNSATAEVTLASFATFGALRSVMTSSSTGSTTTILPHASAITDSYVAFQDRLTFTGGPVNTTGTMIGLARFSGVVSGLASTNNQGFAYGYALANATVSTTTSQVSDRSDDSNPPVVVDQLLTFTLPVKFGVPDFTSLYARLWTEARSGALSQPGSSFWGLSEADFFSSIEWEGIDSVLDSQGNVITGWGVTSASGFDYSRRFSDQLPRQPVPEPGVLVMFLTGLGLAGLAARRRRRQ